jgi:hypothetical protein
MNLVAEFGSQSFGDRHSLRLKAEMEGNIWRELKDRREAS